MENIVLIGCEEVGNAGRNIAGAANSISCAAATLDERMIWFVQRMDELVTRMELAAEKFTEAVGHRS